MIASIAGEKRTACLNRIAADAAAVLFL